MEIPPVVTHAPAARRTHNRRAVWAAVLLFILVLALFITYRVMYHGYIIVSGSMSPTLIAGDKVVASKDSFRTHAPQRFDLVVYRAPATALSIRGERDDPKHPTLYIHRLIGLPGDHIKIVANTGVYVNSALLKEPYIHEQSDYDFPCRPNGDIAVFDTMAGKQLQQYVDKDMNLQVPSGYYFVLGDNRPMSLDSHVWGLLPRENLCGKVMYRYWPLSRFGVMR